MKKKKMKYYVSANGLSGDQDGNWIQPLGFEPCKNLEEADVVIFGGGADVDPSTYGDKKSSRTYTSPAREKEEKEDFTKALKLGKKMVGICRGHQLICAMSGGKLIQDVSGHSGNHKVTTFDEQDIVTNSLHHQMINPYGLDPKKYKILAWSSDRLSNRYMGPKDRSVYLPVHFKEIESIYFPQTDSLGFQYHPEMMYGNVKNSQAIAWTQSIFEKFLNNKL